MDYEDEEWLEEIELEEEEEEENDESAQYFDVPIPYRPIQRRLRICQ